MHPLYDTQLVRICLGLRVDFPFILLMHAEEDNLRTELDRENRKLVNDIHFRVLTF